MPARFIVDPSDFHRLYPDQPASSSLPPSKGPSADGPSDPLMRGGTDVAASSCSSSSSAVEDVDSAASEEF